MRTWLVFLFPFAVYLITLAPSVVGGDSAELVNVAASLGVAHPPGYPLYTLLAYLFSLLPFGEVAWRLNLFSAFCNSLAAVFLYLSLRDVTGRKKLSHWAGFLAAGMFAFAPWIWAYSMVAEVFALNNLILCAIFYVLIQYKKQKSFAPTHLLGLAFLFGLAASNHHAAAFFVLPIAFFLVKDAIREKQPAKFWLAILALFTLGCLPYLHLALAPVFSSSPFLWGETHTWPGFWSHFLRSEYGTFKLGHEDLVEKVSYFSHLWVFLKGLSWQLLGVGLFFLFWSVMKSSVKKDDFKKIVLVCLGAYVLVFFPLSNMDTTNVLDLEVLERFWQQAYIAIVVLVALGFFSFFNERAQKNEKYEGWAAILCSTLVVLQLGLNFSNLNSRSNSAIANFTEKVMLSLPKGSVLFTTGDHLSSSFRYQQHFAEIRPDLKILNAMMMIRQWYVGRQKNGDLIFPGRQLGYSSGEFSLKAFLRENISKGRIFVVNDIRVTDEPLEPFVLVPRGLVDEFHQDESSLDFSLWRNENMEFFREMESLNLTDYKHGSWEHELYRLYWRQYYKYSVNLLKFALKRSEARSYLQESADNLEKVGPHLYSSGRALFDGVDFYYKNLRLAYRKLPQTDKVKKRLAELEAQYNFK